MNNKLTYTQATNMLKKAKIGYIHYNRDFDVFYIYHNYNIFEYVKSFNMFYSRAECPRDSVSLKEWNYEADINMLPKHVKDSFDNFLEKNKNTENTTLYVKTNTYGYHITDNDSDSDEHYPSWSASYTFDIERVSTLIKGYDKFNVKFIVNKGDVVYVLYIEYSSGDSFGNSTGNGEVLWVFKDEFLALQAKEYIEQNGISNYFIFANEKDELVRIYNSYNGYFSGIESVEYKPFVVI